jgi:DNA transformation protein
LDKEFITWLEDVFSAVPDTKIRKMFGGVGLFRFGMMYGLALSDGRIALKADEQTTQEFIDENCEEWSHERKDGKRTQMGYWYIPEQLIDEPEELNVWAMKAYEVAMRADQKKPPSKRKFKEV